MKQKTYDTFAVSKYSTLLDMYLDEGEQDECMTDMESFIDNVNEYGDESELEQLSELDTTCTDCLVIKGY